MITQIRKFLNNTLELSAIDADVSYRDFSDLCIVNCSLENSFNFYIHAINSAKRCVLLNFRDHYLYKNLSNNNSLGKISTSLLDIINAAADNTDKKLILLTQNFYTHEEIGNIKPDNVTVIESPIYMFQNYKEYCNLPPITNKTFSENYHVLCLNNKPRPHRVAIALYINALKLNSIYSTFISKERWEDGFEYDYNTSLSYLYPYSKLHDSLNKISLRNIYEKSANRVHQTTDPIFDYNSWNFETSLVPLYKSVVIDIVTETTSFEKTTHLTEKFVNCIFGKCFPIIIGTFKNVELYRQLGYDMFDDIIDHSYDFEKNPFYRMKMAIDLNIEIITNKKKAVKLYDKHQHRLDKNIIHYKDQYSTVLSNTIGNLDAELFKLGI
jgi:hypothetical protein